MNMLEERRAEILRALVEEHIRTGEPVSSRAILEATALGVSGATVRNELSWLEQEGYAVQPHTSAGRVPTARAFRYYVDHLTPQRIRVSTKNRVSDFFSTVHLELGRLLKATTELLSDITRLPAVVVSPAGTEDRVKALHLVQVGAQTVMVVVVSEWGRVTQEICRLSSPVTPRRVEEAEMLLRSLVVGSDAGTTLATVDHQPDDLIDAASEALHRSWEFGAEVFVGGTRQMATVWEDLSAVQRVLEVLEREAMLLNILATAPGTNIQLGSELPMAGDLDMAVVSTSFGTGHAAGRLGVIGPMRMDYAQTVSAVEMVGRELSDNIGS